MEFPISTGRVAARLGTTEPHVAEAVRRGKVEPKPPVFAGRRMWQPEHVLAVAEALGLRTDDLEAELRDAHRRDS